MFSFRWILVTCYLLLHYRAKLVTHCLSVFNNVHPDNLFVYLCLSGHGCPFVNRCFSSVFNDRTEGIQKLQNGCAIARNNYNKLTKGFC
jgi:hypothetical protein